MKVVVREAVVGDARGIASAHTRAWQVAYDGIVPAKFLASIDVEHRTDAWRQNLEATELPNGLVAPTDFVAEVDGQVVGFVNVGCWREAADDATLAEVWAIYVHPDHWGTGAGYALMKRAVDFLRSGGSVATAYLWVLEDNDQARRFYERQGWAADDVTQDIEIAGATIAERRYSLQLH